MRSAAPVAGVEAMAAAPTGATNTSANTCANPNANTNPNTSTNVRGNASANADAAGSAKQKGSQVTEEVPTIAPVKVPDPDEAASMKWMLPNKEPGAKVKKRDEEESSAGPSQVVLQSPQSPVSKPKKSKSGHPQEYTTHKSSGGSRTDLCGIFSGILGRFRLRPQISLGEIDELTCWVNPEETCDWRLNSLTQLHILGKGSFGVVYLVRHKATKELAALKCIEKHHREQAKEARRVEAERVAWQAVSHHPFVATLKAYYETSRGWCFVMEYVSRGTLSQIIRRSGPMPESKAKLVSAQLAHALNFVHSAGYLHRDISSSNVLLDERGNARLIDFGLCQLGLEAKNRCGSLAYMAPEVLRREHYGIGADWWSFGIVLYTMLIGRTPLSQYAAEQNINIQMTRRELRYSMALAAPLRFPRSLSDEAYNILQDILREDPSMRLGCRSGGGFQEIMANPFYGSIDWKALIGELFVASEREKN
ncbi:protein kinase C iota type-like isoform X2 [Ornithodoros turicata]|uniref:protein kinase C iota type-like isoform X2 n=1 Tax=Ornithodoros turicata TaxID=34597 RepID=UPI00313A3354